jgi:hypothetical protein
MRNAVSLVAIAMLLTAVARTPASAGLQILPTMVNVTEQTQGVRAGNWGPAIALGGAIRFQRLRLILRKGGPLLAYTAIVTRLPPMDNKIRVELFAGNESVGTLDFGKWSHDCSNRNEQRGVTTASVDFANFDVVDRARIYITGGGWSNCSTK